MEYADITCASPEEPATLNERVNEAISEDSPAVITLLLQSLPTCDLAWKDKGAVSYGSSPLMGWPRAAASD